MNILVTGGRKKTRKTKRKTRKAKRKYRKQYLRKGGGNPELEAWMRGPNYDEDEEFSYMRKDPDTMGPECGICLNNMYDDDYFKPVWFNGDDVNCKKHIFHNKCVEYESKCPTCRNKTKNIKEINSKELEDLNKTGGKRKTRKRRR